MLQMMTMGADGSVEMRELRHRTKNAFAAVASLLRMEARTVGGEAAQVLAAAADRVVAFERINSFLELSGSQPSNARDLITEIASFLKETMAPARPILIEVHADAIDLTPRLGAVVGLVVNELVTNSLKHAFPNGRWGIILIRCTKVSDRLVLIVQDDGQGSNTAGSGLGLGLIRALTRQLGGDLTQVPTSGTCWRVELPLPR